ncbi:MAG: hypothetical protein KJO84_00765 [Acidimicrobiia bacterium]|nr:hypothetical protein [Acidimicrobiia bacterium]
MTMWSNEEGATTVEWLGLATIAVLVIAVLTPQVRSAAAEIWDAIAGQIIGLF